MCVCVCVCVYVCQSGTVNRLMAVLCVFVYMCVCTKDGHASSGSEME